MKNFILLVIPCMILSLFPDTGIGTYLFTSRECYTITYQPEEYVSSNQPLNNPYRAGIIFMATRSLILNPSI